MRVWQETHPRFHFTPTYASWLNSVEYWFSILQRQVLVHGSFDSVKALQAILDHNRHAMPPQQETTAVAILAALLRSAELTNWCTRVPYGVHPLVTTVHFTGTVRNTCLYNITCANAQGMV